MSGELRLIKSVKCEKDWWNLPVRLLIARIATCLLVSSPSPTRPGWLLWVRSLRWVIRWDDARMRWYDMMQGCDNMIWCDDAMMRLCDATMRRCDDATMRCRCDDEIDAMRWCEDARMQCDAMWCVDAMPMRRWDWCDEMMRGCDAMRCDASMRCRCRCDDGRLMRWDDATMQGSCNTMRWDVMQCK